MNKNTTLHPNPVFNFTSTPGHASRTAKNLTLLGCLLLAVSAPAAQVVWTGAVDTNWSNGGHWTGGTGTGGKKGGTDNTVFGVTGEAPTAGAISTYLDRNRGISPARSVPCHIPIRRTSRTR